MHSNIIDIRTARKSSPSLSAPLAAVAVILSFKSKRDQHLAQLKRAERQFITAETLAGLPDGRTKAIELMMQLSADFAAGAVQGRAATWLWDNLRVLVTDDCELPISLPLRRRRLAE